MSRIAQGNSHHSLSIVERQSSFFKEMEKRFEDPDVSNWIEEIESVPMYVLAVPEQNRTPNVFIASVVAANDCIWYFSEESLDRLILQMLTERPDLFPQQYMDTRSAFEFFAKMQPRGVAGTGSSYYHLQCTKALLKQCGPAPVAELVTTTEKAKAFIALFGEAEAMILENRHIRAFLVKDEFSL